MHTPPSFRGVRLAATLLAAGFTTLGVHAADYKLVDLGVFKLPAAIDDRTDVAVNTPRGPRLIRNGRWHRLAFSGMARAINEHGDIAGDNGALPMLWPRGEEGRQLSLPDGAIFGRAFGVNDARTVVGLFEISDDETSAASNGHPTTGRSTSASWPREATAKPPT